MRNHEDYIFKEVKLMKQCLPPYTVMLHCLPQYESAAQSHQKNSSKRASWDFYAMIKCGTGCNPLVYKGYGCYCGFLGSGDTVDPIDRSVNGQHVHRSFIFSADQHTLSKLLRRDHVSCDHFY